MKLYVLDAKGHWWPEIHKSAKQAGFESFHIDKYVGGLQGYGFVRPSPNPLSLVKHRNIYRSLSQSLKMIQDADQIDLYEDKSSQVALYADWMPETWRFVDKEAAELFVSCAEFPMVSKANEGSSSRNVRILKDKDEALREVTAAFGDGIPVDLGGHTAMQREYLLLQKFIPHTVTYRVNAIGNARAIFFRYCYPDRPVAQTGNVEPCDELNEEMESLLDWSDRFFASAKTKWCAIDVLKDGDKWALLETSLAWPWPSPGRCNEGPIFRSNHKWIGMFDVLMDEIKAGTFDG